MNVYTRFDEIQSMVFIETLSTDSRAYAWTYNLKTVYPPTNTVCDRYNQRTNGPANAHLISGPSISINHTKSD